MIAEGPFPRFRLKFVPLLKGIGMSNGYVEIHLNSNNVDTNRVVKYMAV
jgi:hypothetical protein